MTEDKIKKRDKGRNPKGKVIPEYLLFILILPAFLPFVCSSCKKSAIIETVETDIFVTKASDQDAKNVDLLIYNDDSMKRLDSYQKLKLPSSGTIKGYSSKGPKYVAAIANYKTGELDWSDINSLDAVEGLTYDLDADDPYEPLMSGQRTLFSGGKVPCIVLLTPLMAEVVLRSLKCDFGKRAYSGSKLENVRVYLTNVCRRSPLLSTDRESATKEFINIGAADMELVLGLEHPEYIYKEIGSSVGAEGITPNLHLYCYQNTGEEESLGSPFTRLVIEGEIDGKIFYYPLDINRKDGGTGVERNCRYIFDVSLTRKGSGDPDIAVDCEIAEVGVEIQQWTEKEKQYVSY